MDPSTPKIITEATYVLRQTKVAVFIVTYNAERHIADTLSRIPVWCRPLLAEVYIIDDASTDQTIEAATRASRTLGFHHISIMRNPWNQGYGGNQKIGYTYALSQGYDIVILLHGDGQYPPEHIPRIIAAYATPQTDAVFGSRMMIRSDALRGGMPLYKWVGNLILTKIENSILGTTFTEFHSGYRSYRMRALRHIPFQLNSNDFHFDTDIIIQLVLNGSHIREIPMPTHYGDEECHVNGFRYAWSCFKSAIKSRLHQAGLFFQPNFEIITRPEQRNYHMKCAPTSLHATILRLPWRVGERVLDLGANDGVLSQTIATHGPEVMAIDLTIPAFVAGIETRQLDLNSELHTLNLPKPADTILALDVIEHLSSPEAAVAEIHRLLKPHGTLYASTANIGYCVMRLTHLLGWFNYGKRGILDLTHHRLFTIATFRRLLTQGGFQVESITGFGPPILDAFGNRPIWRVIDRIASTLAQAWPTLFAFNFLIQAKRRPSTAEIAALTIESRQSPAVTE